MCGSSPKPPKPTPAPKPAPPVAPVTAEAPEVKTAQETQRRRLRRSQGRSSTMLVDGIQSSQQGYNLLGGSQ